MKVVLDTNVVVSGLLQPKGNPAQVLALALAGQVDYLVTGNLSDYPVECRRECAVVSPAEFMAAWRRLSAGPRP